MFYNPFPTYGPAGQPDPLRRWRLNRDSPLTKGLLGCYDSGTGWDYVLNRPLSSFNYGTAGVTGAGKIAPAVAGSGLAYHRAVNADWHPGWAKWTESGSSFGPLHSLLGSATGTFASIDYLPTGRTYSTHMSVGLSEGGNGLFRLYATPTPRATYTTATGGSGSLESLALFPLGAPVTHVLSIDTRVGSARIQAWVQARRYGFVASTGYGGIAFGAPSSYASAALLEPSTTALGLVSSRAWKEAEILLFARDRWRAVFEPFRTWVRPGASIINGLWLDVAGNLLRSTAPPGGSVRRVYMQTAGGLVASASAVAGANPVRVDEAGNLTL